MSSNVLETIYMFQMVYIKGIALAEEKLRFDKTISLSF